jgi:two-component system, OmpR family, phosphate regulon sensor histidine kinase PhoR
VALVPRPRLVAFLAIVGMILIASGLLLDGAAPQASSKVWLVIPGAFVAIAALTLTLLRRADRRVTTLRIAAEALGRGELGARVSVDAHDELASLGRALNSTASALEEKLLASESESRSSDAVIANLKQGVALLSGELIIRRANDRFWLIVGLERPREALRLSAVRQPILEEIAGAVVRSGRAVTREVSLYVEERIEYEVAMVPIRGAGSSQALLLSIEDLRPEREMANLRREFVANVSHELKTPLTSIRGYAETLLQGGLEDELHRERFVETIRSQAERLEALVDDLLKLAELERPDTSLDLKDWDLSAVTHDLASTLEEVAARRGLTLAVEATAGIMARIDRQRIELALGNLLDNAIKYTDRGGVLVRVVRDRHTARVSVSDTGRGIAEDHISRIFERFYRVDRGRAREIGGTGLGLSIVKHAILLHGGNVGVESTPGEGSTFWFEIPADGHAER